jgi:Tfp pilus assembly protein PilN
MVMRVNLIPSHRLETRERRSRVRRWAAGCGAFALFLGLVYVCCAVAWSVSSDGLDGDLTAASSEIEELTGSLKAAEAELADAQLLLESIRGIAKQPDWSLLLALVSKSLGDEVVLETFRVGPPSAAGPGVRTRKVTANTGGNSARDAGTAAKNEPPYTLYVSGYARSQAAVSRFVLRLDELDLFERVDLLRTSREAMFEADATGFQVQCSFRWQARRTTP